jgi:hypothetical protein
VIDNKSLVFDRSPKPTTFSKGTAVISPDFLESAMKLPFPLIRFEKLLAEVLKLIVGMNESL